MSIRESVKVIHAGLDDVAGNIVLRGVLSPDSLQLLQFGEYQREVLPRSTIEGMMEAIEQGTIPDIDIGVRGGSYTERDGVFYLKDPCFDIDGKQRVTAALRLIGKGEGKIPRLGAMFHFNTDEDQERKRFRTLNMARAKVSPNILLRNYRHEHPVIQALFGVSTNEKPFVLKGRVCWSQGMQRDHLITALTFARTIGWLHSHIGPGRSTGVDELVRGLSVIGDKLGPQKLRENTRVFFDIIDQCWGIRAVAFREGAVHLRGNFLICVAFVLSRHELFWKGESLTISKDWIQKLRSFPTGDPTIRQLAAGSGKARELLYEMLVRHLNSGRRTQKLRARDFDEVDLASLTQLSTGGEDHLVEDVEAQGAPR